MGTGSRTRNWTFLTSGARPPPSARSRWRPPAATKHLAAATSLQEVADWNVYPTYPQYDSLMHAFATTYPDLCRLDTIGYSYQGRLLLALKISDNVQEDEDEPEFFYTSTMHGDETGGYVMLLHLIDSLLSGYGQGGQIQRLVDSLEIWINPLANPDGTYHGGDNTVSDAVRYNAESIDLNRNYPDLVEGPHPDNNDYAVENVAMMRFMQQHHFVMSANFHAGEETVNYPWDSWDSEERPHADDQWFHYVSLEYADTVHANAPSGYMTGPSNDPDKDGVTNGGDWYKISGGRQDYVTGFLHGREVTIELDDTKLTPASNLLSLWDYNKHSLLNYMEEVLWGLGGYVVDYHTGAPVPAKIELTGHDDEYSGTFADSITGYYRRPLLGGTWDLQVTAAGYDTLILPGVSTDTGKVTWQVIRMGGTARRRQPKVSALQLYPNPVRKGERLHLFLPREDRYTVTLTSVSGRHIILLRDTPLQQGENTLGLPARIRGLWLITVTGERTVPLIQKVIIRE